MKFDSMTIHGPYIDIPIEHFFHIPFLRYFPIYYHYNLKSEFTIQFNEIVAFPKFLAMNVF